MNGDVDGVAPRSRPLSGGLWTLFSWLRRDERDSSSESLSSAGSDRTAASFAFLAPAHYSIGKACTAIPAIGPPTDSYKKRVHECNVRRYYERDLTLHRKYGLYKSEGGTGYNTFTLHNHTTNADSIGKWGRERRATSECVQRRSVHVPGKRRAPLPPTYAASTSGSATLVRRTRKRPAPQPPLKTMQKTNDNTKVDFIATVMNCKTNRDVHSMSTCDTSADCKSEKYIKKDNNLKNPRIRSEKSFLKQIFENRKKNLTADTAPVKILPSISELDKQAAEIIETGRLKALEPNCNILDMEDKNISPKGSQIKGESWFCTKCLKKYSATVKECLYCFPELERNKNAPGRNVMPYIKNEIYTQTDNDLANPSTKKDHKIDDKQKLKEILKEMKDSLPKKSKTEKDHIVKKENKFLENDRAKSPIVSETPTLRIGSSAVDSEKQSNEPSSSGTESQPTQSKNLNNKHVKLDHAANTSNVVTSVKANVKITELLLNFPLSKVCSNKGSEKVEKMQNNVLSNIAPISSSKKDLHTPLRISSLLNPVYIPKNKDSFKHTSKEILPAVCSNSLKKSDEIKHSNTVSSKSNTETNESIIQAILTTNDKAKVNNNIETKGQSRLSLLQKDDSQPIKEDIKLEHLEPYPKEKKINITPPSVVSTTAEGNDAKAANLEKINQHARRRELVNQLEKSIAKGDEQAAADAAIKLAQLRLSCSVLSFSSQIVAEPSTSISPGTSASSCHSTEIEGDKALVQFEVQNEDKSIKVQLPEHKPTKEIVQLQKKVTSTPVNYVKLIQSKKNSSATSSVQNERTKNQVIVKNEDVQIQQKTPTESKNPNEEIGHNISIQVWIEDKEAARGPIHLNTRRQARMGELRMQAEAVLGLPARLQRWIVGRTLCTDDNIPIATLAGPAFSAPFYLCLVEPGQADGNIPSTSHIQVDAAKSIVNATVKKTIIGSDIAKAIGENTVKAIVEDTVKIMIQSEEQAVNVYKELVKLEQQALVPNAEAFECGVCMDECPPDHGVILRECVHTFCRECLSDLVRHCEEPDVFCPAMGCRGMLQEREIRALVTPEDYERWLARGLAAAESGTRNAFHCRTRDCTGWALCDPGVLKFPCPVCKHTNCVPCQAIHEGETCENYRLKLQSVTNVESDQLDGSTRALINTLINKGEALECPECKAIITKKWGCDWVKCSACKTEICWVTRGKRWGPAGRGDTSAGCRCGVDGKKCHPSCGYCH